MTAMGNDNEGGLSFTYGLEDTDMIGTKAVFNAYDSKLWCYVRDNFGDELQAMFLSLESNLAWSASRIISECETIQQYKPERLWIADMRRKCFRPYEDDGTTTYLDMMYGDKKHQRRQFQTYQEKYMSSKYVGSACTSDTITVRGYTPSSWTAVEPDGTFHIIPYADMYIVVKYGSYTTQVRAVRGTTYEIESPITAMNDTEVYVYNASFVQSIGDISGFYPGYTDFASAVKLTDLLIGNGAEGYSNTNMASFNVGNNILLEYLNLQNLPNLTTSIDLSGCINLETFLADGSGITGVIFASGGNIETAHLPAITSLTAKNLYKLTDLQIADYSNITTLTIEYCDTIDVLSLVEAAENLSRVRILGIDWELDSTDLLDRLAELAGIDESGYNTTTSVLAGTVHVPVMREQKLNTYAEIWPDLEVTYDTLMTQYTVTFVNADEDSTVLDVQYVDIGGDAVDPTTREDDPIDTPTLESTVSTDYTFSGWDDSLTSIFANKTITAVYTESVRQYTVTYKSKGTVLQSSTGPYGTLVPYEGVNPTYTAGESAYSYNLFTGWDQSGYVTGDKTINAVFDTCEYSEGIFDGKELADLRPVELYAIMNLGLESSLFETGDSTELEFGNDYNYDDVDQVELISSTVEFNGTNYIDTGVSLMDEDRSFVFAIDYQFATSGNSTNSTLAQCFQYNGSNGFRLWYSSNPLLSWGTSSTGGASLGSRSMTVIRHVAGSETITVYESNMSSDNITTTTLTAARVPTFTSNVVFGAALADDGTYENYASGMVHWSKVWYTDLGDTACQQLAQWAHETIPVSIAKFKSYYLSSSTTKRAPITFLADYVMQNTHQFTNSSSNSGGWATATLNTWLNNRLYKALPPAWQSLIQQVTVTSSIGGKSTATSTSDCYFYVPALYELDSTSSTDPYINETDSTIAYMTGATARKRASVLDPNTPVTYWTRSPNVSHTNYIYSIDEEGYTSGYGYPTYSYGVLLEFSISP